MILCYVDEIEKIAREGIEESDSRSKNNIAQNQSFAQKGIGVKYKTMQNGPPSKISLFLAISLF